MTTQPPPRDRYGRPMIKPVGGGPAVPYTRASSLGSILDNKYALEKWSQRLVVRGLAQRPDLAALAAAARDDDRELDKIVEQAKEAAGATARANLGTALHSLTEQIDRGQPADNVPLDLVADVAAYVQARDEAGLKVVAVEQFVVCDELQAAGTFDRLYALPSGEVVVGDLKTGRTLDYSGGSIAVQLCIYARGAYYDHETGTRTPLPAVDPSRGLIVHLPAGQGTAALYWVDLATGWCGADTANAALEYRRMGRTALRPADDLPVTSPLLRLVQATTTHDELVQLYRANQAAWSPQINEAAKAHKVSLSQAG